MHWIHLTDDEQLKQIITIRWDLVTEPFSNVISHLVSRFSGVNPASPKTKLSFIVKQPACAAATNSSGFVPTPSAKRELNEYCVLFNTVLAVVNVPLPSFPEPFQTAVALRIIAYVVKDNKTKEKGKGQRQNVGEGIAGLLVILALVRFCSRVVLSCRYAACALSMMSPMEIPKWLSS